MSQLNGLAVALLAFNSATGIGGHLAKAPLNLIFKTCVLVSVCIFAGWVGAVIGGRRVK